MKKIFFKGYIETSDKKAIEKFKNRKNFKTFEQVEKLEEFAGVLDENTVLIDVDDKTESDILFSIIEELDIECRVYETTRGKHFLFLNDEMITGNKTNAKMAVGLYADIKIGSRNSYEVLKYKNKFRKILRDTENPSTVPKFLLPVKSTINFLDMTEGNGRNQTLFNYILTLQSNDFTVDEVRKTINLINDFVIPEPLEKNEIETILRDEAFEKQSFFKGTTFLFHEFAKFLKNHHHIKRINNRLHLYQDGYYISGQANIEAVMIKHIPNLNKTKRNEVLSYLDILIREDTPLSNAKYIVFKNGVLNIETKELFDFNPDFIITNKIDWDWNPKAYFEVTDNVLNNLSCHDKKIRALLEEMIGYCFYRRNELAGSFILTGSGSNGKSTLLNLIKKMLGKSNYSALDIKKLNDRFSTVMLVNKLANIGDDISDEFISDSSYFKKIVTGETIDAEEKGIPKFNFDPYSKLIFSANNIPRIGKGRDTDALTRRLIIVPLRAKFSKETMGDEFKPYIGDELNGQESMEYLIRMGIEGLLRVLKNNGFTKSEKVIEEMREFEESNNPLIAFFNEVEIDDILHEETKTVYLKYTVFCSENSIQAISNIAFSKEVRKRFNVKSVVKKIDGKSTRVFERNEESE